MRKIFFIIISILFIGQINAQQELSLYFMDSTWISMKTNPAFVPKQNFAIGLPSFYFDFNYTGATFEEVSKKEGNTRIVDVDLAVSKLENTNYLKNRYELETLSGYFKIKGISFSIGHAIKYNTYVKYPKNFAELAWNGNAQFIGETIDFGPDFQLFSYNEFALGFAHKIKNFTFGARIKYLTGIADISTDKTDVSLHTDEEIYALTVDSDYRINTSSVDASDIAELDFGGITVDFEDAALLVFGLSDYGFNIRNFSGSDIFTKNTGVAFDLGVDWQATKKLSLNASILDVGKIKWKEDVNNYYSSGVTSYNGIELSGLGNDSTVSFQNAIDTLENILDFAETSQSYETDLPTRIYLGATYKFNNLLTFGGLFYSESYRDEQFSAVAISATAHINKAIHVGAVYSYRNNKLSNLGLNMTFNVGGAQLFAVTDNIIPIFDVYNSNNVNGRIGVTLVF